MTDPTLQLLIDIALASDALAKQLGGHYRSAGYRIKARACSALLLEGLACPNSWGLDDIVGLDILSAPPIRIHIRRAHLSREARLLIDQARPQLPRVASLADYVVRSVSSRLRFAVGHRSP